MRKKSPGILDRMLAAAIARKFEHLGVELKLWDEPGRRGEPPYLRVTEPSGLRRIARGGAVGVAEAYVAGELEIGADLRDLLERANGPGPGRLRGPGWLRNAMTARSARRNDRAAGRANALSHYDLGNDFFALWLDPTMSYTCAFFETPTTPLEEAQRAKLDLVCRKLALEPGDRVVEAGAGWGALAIHMARAYGAHVTAYNVSPSQTAFARERAKCAGVADRVEFIEDDYRAIGGGYDAFVSIGMLEAVGPADYPTFGETIARAIGDQGRALVHSIGRTRPYPTDAWIDKRIFPGSYKPAPSEWLRVFEPNELVVQDVENLRGHYTNTLEHWLTRFEENEQAVAQMYSPEFVRMWRLYLASAAAAFATGWLQLYQVVATAPGHRAPPPRARIMRRTAAPTC